MIASKKRDTNLGIAIGLGLQVGGRLVLLDGRVLLGTVLVGAGLAAFLWGCVSYVEGKGYSRWWGLLGLGSVVGLLAMVVMRDRRRDFIDGWPETPSSGPRADPFSPGPQPRAG